VSRLHVLGDEPAQAAGRQEIERFRLTGVLQPRGVPWLFLTGPEDELPALVGDRLTGQTDHTRAGAAAVRELMDRIIAGYVPVLADRQTDYERVGALQGQLAAYSNRLRDLPRIHTARAVEQIHTAEDKVSLGLAAVIEAAGDWLAVDGVTAMPDAEGPVRRAWAQLVRQANELVDGLPAGLRAETARFEDAAREALAPILTRSSATPHATAPQDTAAEAGTAEATAAEERTGSDWELADLRDAVKRLDEVALAPVLQRSDSRVRAALEEQKQEQKQKPRPEPGPKPAGRSDDGSIARHGAQLASSARHHVQTMAGAAASMIQKLNSMPVTEELLAALLADLKLMVGSRLDDVTAAIEREGGRAARAEVEATVQRLNRLVSAADEALAERYSWFGAYSRLLALRADQG